MNKFHCNNLSCRRDIEGSCFLSGCFHIFCESCAQEFAGQCPVCGRIEARLVPMMIPAGRSTSSSLVGCGVDEIVLAVRAAATFLRTQKEFERKVLAAKLASGNKALEELKVKLEAEKKQYEQMKETNRKLVFDQKLLSSRVKDAPDPVPEDEGEPQEESSNMVDTTNVMASTPPRGEEPGNFCVFEFVPGAAQTQVPATTVTKREPRRKQRYMADLGYQSGFD